MKIRNKLMLTMLVLFVVVLGVSALVITTIRDNISDDVRVEMEKTNAIIANLLHSNIDNNIQTYLLTIAEKTKGIVEHHYQNYQDGVVSEAEAYQQVRSLFLDPAYGNIGETGYLAGVNGKGVLVIHPRSEGVDASGHDFMRQAITRKTGYLEYEWQNKDESAARAKVGGLAYFAPWDLIIWASSYQEEFRSLINIDEFRRSISSIQLGKYGYLYIIDTKGNYIVHPQLQGQNGYNSVDANGRHFLREICEGKQGSITYSLRSADGAPPKEKIAYYHYIKEMDWIVVSSAYTEEVFGVVDSIVRIMLLTLLIALLVSLLLSQLLADSVTKPIISLKKISEEIIKGNYLQQAHVETKDEIGDLGKAFNNMTGTIQKNFTEILEQKKKIEDYSKNLEVKVAERTQEIHAQNLQITESIQYAKTIQSSILPDQQLIHKHVAEAFVIWKPRDIVGGDFYWFREIDGGYLIALIDCTGHSVPGAFITMMAYSILDTIIDATCNDNPAVILRELNIRLQKALHNDLEESMADVGLDIGLCYVIPSQHEMVYAGAKISLFYTDDEEVVEVKGDNKSIGYKCASIPGDYLNHTIPIKGHEVFYMTSDGYLDQKGGGEKDFAFGKRRFTDIIHEAKTQSLAAQKIIFEFRLQEFMQHEEQRDDITVVGFKVRTPAQSATPSSSATEHPSDRHAQPDQDRN